MTEIAKQPPLVCGELPAVEDAVLADMSGPNRLTQDALWNNVGAAHAGMLAAWALSEAGHVQATNASPRDAFLRGVGYAITALGRQLVRDKNTQADIEFLNASFDATNAPEVTP